MLNKAFRTATPIFIGVVFFLSVGCSTFLSSNNQSSSQSDNSEQQLTDEIAAIEENIEQNPSDGDLYLRKAKLLQQMAQQKAEPAQRTPIYREMSATLEEAEKQLNESGQASSMQEIDEFLNVSWSNEHNQGVQETQSDSSLAQTDFEKAISHFNNATIILPDTAISYQLKARTQYQNRDTEGAIQTLENARENIEPLPVELIEQLAFLYLETGQTDQAANIYKQAESVSNEDSNILHGLANTYIEAEEHYKALEVLNILTDQEPDNIIYVKAKGTQLYFAGTQKMDSLQIENIDQEKKERLFSEGDSLCSEATTYFQQAFEENEQDDQWKQELADFYHTVSAKYQQALPYLPESLEDPARQKITDFLETSIPLYRSLVEQYPEKELFWNNLYIAYSYLDMDEEAEQAKSNLTEF